MSISSREFTNPGSQYRGKPFWAWNGKLEPDELRRQVRIMHRMGLGGFFMHSRVGLGTKYLSEEWFDCIRACVDEAKKLGMEAWLYDEDRWPSGAAGGLVTKNPKYRPRFLGLYTSRNVKDLTWNQDTLAAAVATIKGRAAYNVRDVPRGKRPGPLKKGESLLIYRVFTARQSAWYNGQTYLDTISHEAVRKFIDVTHEAYRRKVGEEFGGVVPGIFTDEPHHNWVLQAVAGSADNPGAENVLPWTKQFPAIFRERYGYDLQPNVTNVFFNVEGEMMHRQRYDYHDCLTFLFCDAFGRQIGQWCEKNNLQFTGHTLEEKTLSSQVSVSATMRFYEHMQAPGMDLLREVSREYDTAKQVSSAARQFGRTWRLTETYGCTGWDFPFAGHKALGDWQAALGINLRCQHLSWYTMAAEAKRDYPASIFYQSPWWESYEKVENYFARIHAVMTRGKEVRDLLVLHPLESMWMLFRVGWRDDAAVEDYNQMLVRLRDTLLGANIDFDYGDEDILARYGKARKSDGRLLVNKADYKTVLVPPMLTIRRSTLTLLKKFAAAGGTVVFAGDVPRYVDVEPSDEAKQFARQCLRAPAKGAKLAAAVESTSRRVNIRDADGNELRQTLHLLREDKEAFYLFVCNVGYDYTQSRPGPSHMNEPFVLDRNDEFPRVQILGFGECKGQPIELDPDTGEMHQADAKCTGGRWTIRTSLTKLGSRLFVIPKRKGKSISAAKSLKTVGTKTLKAANWDIQLSECNNLVLDFPRWKVGKGAWNRADEILRVDRKVRGAAKLPWRGGSMVQPWARTKPKDGKSLDAELEYTFEVRDVPAGELFLAIEDPQLYTVRINGQRIDTDAECGWWVDRSLRKLPVDPAILRVGTNQVQLHCRYDAEHPGFEMIYLLGDFGVKVKGQVVTMTPPPRTLKLGDWTKQGLGFYSGSVAYRTTFQGNLGKGQKLFVRVTDYKGVGVRILVNGQSAGVIAWEPGELDITDFVQSGRNELAIQVLGHRRNSHGPLHVPYRPHWVGPGQFITEGKDHWIDEYQLVSCGLTKEPQLVTKR
ncbi:MAG: hypothetical protein JXA11_09905 [Phycisphaerae bacterium]|nr:hypothetical protein [Phycisphaerae bacterium]